MDQSKGTNTQKNVPRMDAHVCQRIELRNPEKKEKEATHEGLEKTPTFECPRGSSS